MTTLNSYPCDALTLTVPRVGAWTADVELVDAPALTGSVELVVDGRARRGFVHRGGVESGRWRGRIVGGAGGLGAILGPTAFADTTLAVVLEETLREAGEALAPTSGDLTATVARWARIAGPTHHTVADVARAAGYVWRVLDDGAVWVGPETWSPLSLGADLDVIEHDPATGRYDLGGVAAQSIDPGRVVTLDGDVVRVGALEHRLSDDVLRAVLYADRAADAGSRLTAAFDAMARRALREVDYLAVYPAKVVQQNDDGTLDVLADSPRVALPRAIRYRTLPGLELTVPAGTRVAVGFEQGDPSRPYAALWELGDVTRWALDGGTHRAAREGHATADGAVSASTSPPAGTPPLTNLTLTYTPPGGAPQTLTINGLPGNVTVTGAWTIAGEIDEGSDVLRLP